MTLPIKMTERAIQRALFIRLRDSAQIALPNYTPFGWHECDLWAVTKAGYMREYEIKLSVADFKADATKHTPRHYANDGHGGWEIVPSVTKHDRLATGDERGPTRFWYCTPIGLLADQEIPAWAGLMEFEARRERVFVAARSDGPRLHRQKVAETVLVHARGVCYWRYWNALLSLYDVQQIRQRQTEMANA